jgi:hypothetical protein
MKRNQSRNKTGFFERQARKSREKLARALRRYILSKSAIICAFAVDSRRRKNQTQMSIAKSSVFARFEPITKL